MGNKLVELGVMFQNRYSPNFNQFTYNELRNEVSVKIQEAVRRLTEKRVIKSKIISEEELYSCNEGWDGEADGHVEWLSECLRVIRIYVQVPDEEPYFDEERAYELEMDRRYHQFHGDVPPWAQ